MFFTESFTQKFEMNAMNIQWDMSIYRKKKFNSLFAKDSAYFFYNLIVNYIREAF